MKQKTLEKTLEYITDGYFALLCTVFLFAVPSGIPTWFPFPHSCVMWVLSPLYILVLTKPFEIAQNKFLAFCITKFFIEEKST